MSEADRFLRSHPLALGRFEACYRSPPCNGRFAHHGLTGRTRTPRRSRFFFVLSREEFGIQDTTKRVRVNRQIRISPVRVIGADGSQLGILEVDAALRMAEDLGLDLVEVAATARPPVVRIMDYGKYKFEMAKQARLAKKKQHVIELKEVKYRPGIDDHDFDTKTRHARRFLEEKNKVKVTMMFRGRQVAHPELGQAVLERVATALADVGKIESAGRLEGKSMTMILAPK
ncbi:MAG TPA: translation initiation factor IF-3 [Gemmatimonadaceae bacterium]